MSGEFKPRNGVILNDQTATTVPYLDSNKKFTSSAVTPTELGYLSGTTRSIATKFSESVSIMDYGATGDGSTNDNAAIVAALAAIGSSNKELVICNPIKFSSNRTFPANIQLRFTNNGKLIGTTGSETLTLNGPIIAPAMTIFQTCVPTMGYGCKLIPEWFGAAGDGSTNDYTAIQATITALAGVRGIIEFGPKTYNIGTVLNITSSYLGLQGAGQYITRLMATGAAQSAIQFVGTNSSNTLHNNFVYDMYIGKTVTCTGGVGITLQHTTVAKIRDCQVADFGYGVYLLNATNTLASRVICSNSAGSFDFKGFYIDGADVAGNVSSQFRDCWVDGAGNTSVAKHGFYAVSATADGSIQDLYFDSCSTASTNFGFYLDWTNCNTTPRNFDIFINNPVVDQFTDAGIQLSNSLNEGAVTIVGGWLNSKSGASNAKGIYLASFRGATITGTQVYADTNYANAYGVYLETAQNITVNSCLFQNQKYGIYSNVSEFCSFVGNRFYATSGKASTTHINFTSTETKNIITGNILDGYATNGIVLGASTVSNQAFNNVYGSNVTTPLTDGAPTSNNKLGIGTASPTSPLEIYNPSSSGMYITGDSAVTSTIQRSSTDASEASLSLRKTRGTVASRSAVTSSDALGSIYFQAYGGTNTRNLAYLRALVDTYTSDSNISSYLSFGTSSSGAASATEKMKIDAAGNVNIAGLTASRAVVTDSSKNLTSLQYTSAATASTIMSRDANANVTVNNPIVNYTSTTSAAGTLTLTVASSRKQYITGSSSHTVKLPDATTLPLGFEFEIKNNSTSTVGVSIVNAGSTQQALMSYGSLARCVCTDIGSANGVWDISISGGAEYTPTNLNSGGNVAVTNLYLYANRYQQQNGNITVSGYLALQASATTGSSFTLSLPLGFNITAVTQCSGDGNIDNAGGTTRVVVKVGGDTTNDGAAFYVTAPSTSTSDVNFIFNYKVY
jgi:parallel beta-helix repeat protein